MMMMMMMMMMMIEDAEEAEHKRGRQKGLRSELPARKPPAKDAADSEPTSNDPVEANIIEEYFAPFESP